MSQLAIVSGQAGGGWLAALEANTANVGADPAIVWRMALDEHGSDTEGPDNSGEFSSTCPSPGHNGGSGDHKASLRWSQAPDGQVIFHCVRGDTRVVTRQGTRPISELAGSEWDLLVPGVGSSPAHWQRCPVRSFGVQPLTRVTLTRSHLTKTVYTTAEHRWFVEQRHGAARVEVVTRDLEPGQRLASIRAQRNRVSPSPYGVMHGFVFGDGTLVPDGSAQAQFVGRKDEAVLPYFSTESKVLTYEDGWVKKIRGLPRAFKHAPGLDESASYLYGWLAGYFAADGHVSKSTPAISSARRENLEAVRDVASRLGIVTYPIREYVRDGFNGPEPLYYVSLQSGDLTPEFFLHDHHRAAWNGGTERLHLGWKVVSVEETGLEEEVYCAVVEGAGAFALEDNLLTGNCHAGCDGEDIVTALGLTFVQLRWSRTEYGYLDEFRNPLATHVKSPQPGGKKRFWWEHEENGVSVNGRGPGWTPVLWCLPDLQHAAERARADGKQIHLWLCEGEKDAYYVAAALEAGWTPEGERTADGWTHLTTSSPDGAATWSQDLTAQIIGLGTDRITIPCDSDEAGARRGTALTDALLEADPTARIDTVNWAGQRGVKDASDAIARWAAGWLREASDTNEADTYLWCSSETGWLFEADTADLDGQSTGRRALHRMVGVGTKGARPEAITKWPVRIVAVTKDPQGDPVGWELDLGPGGTRLITAADLAGSALELWNTKVGVFIVPTRGLGPALRAYLGYHSQNSLSMSVWDHEGWVADDTFVTGAGVLIGPAGLIGRSESGVTEWNYGEGPAAEAVAAISDILTYRPLKESAPVIGWLAAVAVRPHALEVSGSSFVPMLQIPGDSGTGKTTFLKLANRVFGLSGNAVSNVTTAGLVRTLALSTQVVWIDDFANYDDAVRDIIRGGVTGAGRTRGTTASERGIVRDEARASLINSGETAMGLEERAMRQRSVVVPFTERAQGRTSRRPGQTRGQYADMVELGVDREDRGTGLSRYAGTVVRGLYAASCRVRQILRESDGSDPSLALHGANDGVREAAAWRFVEYGSLVMTEWMRAEGVDAPRLERLRTVVRTAVAEAVAAAERRERSGADIHLVTTLVPAYLRARRVIYDSAVTGRVREGEALDGKTVIRIVRDAWRTADCQATTMIDGRPARGAVTIVAPDPEGGEHVVALALCPSALAEWAQSDEGRRAGIGTDRRFLSKEGIGMQVGAISSRGTDFQAGGGAAGKVRVKLSANQTPQYSVVTDRDVIGAILGS